MQEEGTQGSSSTAAVLDYATPTAAATAADDVGGGQETFRELRRRRRRIDDIFTTTTDGRHELNSGDDFVPSPEMERELISDFIALNRKQMCGDTGDHLFRLKAPHRNIMEVICQIIIGHH